MKTISAFRFPLWLLLALVTGHSSLVALGVTPFSYQFYNSDGSANTNTATMEAWPRSTNGWTVYGTNLVWGSQTITLTNAGGYGTNLGAFPNVYRVWFSNLNSGFYVRLPDTNLQVSLGACVVAVPQVAGPVTLFSQITNALGFYPLASNTTSLLAALGYTPATNGLAAITNTVTAASMVGMLGYQPASNSAAGIKFALGYTPATNSLVGITNALGYLPQPTNVVLTASVIPPLGTIGVTNLNSTLLTNLGTGTVICWTNLAAGVAPTLGAPDGSLLIATNGNLYTRSNATWVNLK